MARTAARRNQIAVELERQRDLLRRQRERDDRILRALYQISLACRDRPSLRDIFTVIYHELTAVFDFDACYIAFCDEQPEVFQGALLVDEGEMRYVEGVSYGKLTGSIVRSREPLLFRDLLYERDEQNPPESFGHHEKRSRSWLGVPLKIGANVVGVISIQSYQIGIYSEETRDLLQQMGNVIAVALENVSLIQRLGEVSTELTAQVLARTEELSAMSRIAAAMVVRQPLPDMLDWAIGVALELFKLDAGTLRLLDDTREALLLQAQRGFDPAYSQALQRSLVASSPLRNVVLMGQPQIIPRGWRARYNPELFPLHLFPSFECALSLPLSIGANVLGTLSLFGLEPRDFSEHEVRLAQAVANQIAVIIENTRLLEERERQIAELRALSSVSHAASTAQDLRTLLRQVHDALQEFIPLDAFSMVICDLERQVISDGVSIDEGHTYDYWSNQPPPQRSLTAWILHHGQALRFENLPEQIARLPEIEILHSIGAPRQALSWLGVPMFDRERRVIGMITVQAYTPGLFGDRDEAFMHNVAAQVALHVQNVRLLTQRDRQISELKAIGQIARLVTASYDLNRMLDEVRRVVVELTDASVFYLIICEPGSRQITNAIFVEEGNYLSLDFLGNQVHEGTLSDWILRNREPLLFQDLVDQRDEMFRRGITPVSVGPANPVRSWAGVPLVARDGELIGVLSVQDYRPYRYDDDTVDFLDQVASSVSLGVQKVRLFEERERQAAENARLFTSAQAHAEAAERQAQRIELVHRIASLLGARLDEQEIHEIACRELVQLFWADHSATVIIQGPGRGYVAGEHPAIGTVGLQLNLEDNLIVSTISTTRRPVVITDFENDPLAFSSRDLWRSLGIESLVIAPLISRDRVFGTISLDSFQGPFIFSEEELDLLMTVATSIGAAVENAQLFAAEQEQRRTADTLREMARVLSTSFDPQEVLRLVLGELQKVINFDSASIMLLDGLQLRLVASRGRSLYEPRSIVLPLEGSGAGEVVSRREPILRVIGEGEGPWMHIPTSQDIYAWLGVPLIARGDVLGVLNIDVRNHGSFSERDIEVARTFANHAALAIENARLYQESITRVEQELEIARRIQLNLFPRELPAIAGLELAARCLPARETGGDFYDLVDLGARVGVIVGDVSGKSLPAAMLMAVARSTARSEARNHETPWVVLTETNRWLVDDVPRHNFVALSYAVVDPYLHRLSIANGGQLSPLLRRADGDTSFLTCPPALPLGLYPETEYSQFELDLLPGDTLLFYTDGIVEAHDQTRSLFGFERLEQLFAQWGHLEPDALIERIIAEVHAFAEGMPPHDDMTLVVVRVSG